jgi:CMP-N,N'-diacetyllegionaminic acid synthase
MSDRNKRLALIPARSGSKGVPDKNIRQIGGHSLLSRAIAAARDAGLFDRIFVSTDSPDYAMEAAREGVETPWLRPAELAADTALVADTIRHTLEEFAQVGERFDTIALLEPTSPLRRPEDIAAVVKAAETEGWDAGFTVSAVPIHYHPLKQFQLDADGAAGFVMDKASPNVNRQSLSRTFIRNGIAYAVRSTAFLQTGSIHGTRARAIEIDRPVVSIDTDEDFIAAAALLAERTAGKDA